MPQRNLLGDPEELTLEFVLENLGEMAKNLDKAGDYLMGRGLGKEAALITVAASFFRKIDEYQAVSVELDVVDPAGAAEMEMGPQDGVFIPVREPVITSYDVEAVTPLVESANTDLQTDELEPHATDELTPVELDEWSKQNITTTGEATS